MLKDNQALSIAEDIMIKYSNLGIAQGFYITGANLLLSKTKNKTEYVGRLKDRSISVSYIKTFRKQMETVIVG